MEPARPSGTPVSRVKTTLRYSPEENPGFITVKTEILMHTLSVMSFSLPAFAHLLNKC
jgi:hypothetical protein